MKTFKIAFLLCVAATLLSSTITVARAPNRLTLEQKIARADAILVATVHEVDSKRLQLRILAPETNGEGVRATSTYDLALLHPERILKTDSEHMINKKDASNPADWMHMAQRTANPGKGEIAEGGYPPASKGDRKIWYLRHDNVFSGSYFLDDAEPVTDARVQEIEKLTSKKVALN